MEEGRPVQGTLMSVDTLLSTPWPQLEHLDLENCEFDSNDQYRIERAFENSTCSLRL